MKIKAEKLYEIGLISQNKIFIGDKVYKLDKISPYDSESQEYNLIEIKLEEEKTREI